MQKVFHFEADRKVRSGLDAGIGIDAEKLQSICSTALESSFPEFRDAEIEAKFYPYVGLTHTLRRKKAKWVLRISDHCRSAPVQVIEAIVKILACRVMRRKPPRKVVEAYDQFRREPGIESAVRGRRAEKGRKQFSVKPGKYHSLRKIYRELNERYFNSQIEIKRIGWGLRKGRGRLGHYDPIHNTITLSPVLDDPNVPLYVVRYIVYHEMLHVLFGQESSGGSRKHHPVEFRNIERAYPDYRKAKKFLDDFTRKLARSSG
jgi:predicted metal-dependent hydrolase